MITTRAAGSRTWLYGKWACLGEAELQCDSIEIRLRELAGKRYILWHTAISCIHECVLRWERAGLMR
ncbi:MAG: hypothetical protein CMM01_15810 [Rhodopirellula sp.]|nr:hypothetical protein [Rhodopirellula sp.]